MKQAKVFIKDAKFTQPCAISNSSLTWLNVSEMIICKQKLMKHASRTQELSLNQIDNNKDIS